MDHGYSLELPGRGGWYGDVRPVLWVLCALWALASASCGGRPVSVSSMSYAFASDTSQPSRCEEHRVERVPPTHAELEAEIMAWIATCVTSRTNEAHRERGLVGGNISLARLWPLLEPGKPARIRASYHWEGERVVLIRFSAPGRAAQALAAHRGESEPVTEAPVWTPQRPQSVPLPTLPEPRRTSLPARPDEMYGSVDPPVSDQAKDLVADARKLAELLRRLGKNADASRLEAIIEPASKYVISVGILVGTYYMATKLVGGKLLFMWGWTAAGPHFQRALARLPQLLPQTEQSLGQIVHIARQHRPELAGSGIDWKVLDQLVDPSIPAQLDGDACGPACVQMVLRDRGIDISQEELIHRARSVLHPEIKTRMVSARTLTNLLRELDPRGGWIADPALKDDFLEAKSARQVIDEISSRGSWIALVARHFVVVDGMDSAGYVLIRDPWYEVGLQRGIHAGSHYRVSLATFVENWLTATAVHRR